MLSYVTTHNHQYLFRARNGTFTVYSDSKFIGIMRVSSIKGIREGGKLGKRNNTDVRGHPQNEVSSTQAVYLLLSARPPLRGLVAP